MFYDKTATWKELEHFPIERGDHAYREEGLCALEMVAWVEGEEHSDTPESVCAVIGSFIRRWNDDMGSDLEREILRPILPRLIGTADNRETKRRSGQFMTWLINKQIPSWIELVPELEHYACLMRNVDWRKQEDVSTLRTLAQYTEHIDGYSKSVDDGRTKNLMSVIAASGADAAMDAVGTGLPDEWNIAYIAVNTARVAATKSKYAATAHKIMSIKHDLKVSAIDLINQIAQNSKESQL